MMKNIFNFGKTVFSLCLLLSLAGSSLGQTVVTLTLESSADATVKEDYPTQNFGSNDVFAAAVLPRTGQIYRGLLRFDIPETLKNATIVSATLSLTAYLVQGPDITCRLAPAIMDWNETTVTWDDIPKTAVNGAVMVPLPADGGSVFNLRIDNIVQSWVLEEIENYGFVLEMIDESTDDTGMSFWSKECTTTNQRPKLTIKYYFPDDKSDDADANYNWTQQTVYDDEGNIVSQSRQYFDDLANNIQNQAKVYKYCSPVSVPGGGKQTTCADYISVVSTFYDRNQRPALTTLPTPIFANYFSFAANVITDHNGGTFDYHDFENTDVNQTSIGHSGLLYHYYGGWNPVDMYADYCLWPYTRTEYSSTQPGAVRHSCLAGSEHTFGSGHESQQYTLMGDYTELPDYNPSNLPFIQNTGLLTKNVVIDPDGKEVITFSDHLGRQIASCRSGSDLISSLTISAPDTDSDLWYDDPTGGSYTGGTKIWYFDLHIPDGCYQNNTLTMNPAYSLSHYYRIINLKTDEYISVSGNINFDSEVIPFPAAGFYRLEIFIPKVSPVVSQPYQISLVNNYYDFSYTYYDLNNNVLTTTPPEGVSSLLLDATATYDSRGLPRSATSPDEGIVRYIYRKDGQIRCSQNAQQLLDGTFSYTNYDEYGRVVESGISRESSVVSAFGTLTDGDAITLDPVNCMERSYISYDFPDNTLQSLSGLSAYYKTQTNLAGAVSSTSNENVTTYYSYNTDGQVEWIVRNYPVLGPKTIKYEYNQLGALASDLYQEGQTIEQIKHIYTYNPNGSLRKTETLRPSDEMEPQLQSLYKYSYNGSLKRMEIGHGRFSTHLQGIDYIYNCNGWLKTINSPEMTTPLHMVADDPVGGDDNDIFGMSLDYYTQDYKKYNFYITSDPVSYTNYYDGKIASIRWKIQHELPYTNIKDYAYSWFMVYTYDSRNWLNEALFKKVLFIDQNGNPSYYDIRDFDDYKLFGITYDANGNIKTLRRNGSSSGGLAMDDLTYRYDYVDPTQPSAGIHSNRLYHVNDANATQNYPGELTDQGTFSTTNISTTNNYRYDAVGKLVDDFQSFRHYFYNAYGHLSSVSDGRYVSNMLGTYQYNENGFRYHKAVWTGSTYLHTWYVHDVSGNVLAVYEASGTSQTGAGLTPTLTELPVYGASRIGQIRPAAGTSLYELTDHQGSLRALVKRGTNQTVAIAAYKDYYPYGQLMPDRNYQTTDYRYGYQGQYAETDPETGFAHFEAREFDSRLGRWMVPDPARQHWSPYLGMGNNPVSRVDPDGMRDGWWKTKGSEGNQTTEWYPVDEIAAANPNLEYVGDENYTFGTVGLNGPTIQGFRGSGAVSCAMERSLNSGYNPNWWPETKRAIEGGYQVINALLNITQLDMMVGGLIGEIPIIQMRARATITAAKGVVQAEKVSGSYLLKFQSGKFYAGKGLEPRMMQSINRIETTYGDKLLNSTFYPASSTKAAFINEHKLMMQFGGPKSFNPLSPTYNKIFSPGRNLGGF
ncbi:MAG: DNRLRE domain-containing protein [Bacteroidales bacterium]|nr:DNRLRE domain-containing protein [Bacteroidales bacterium]